MTKVNENGQLEWTFEELDFEGAKKEVELTLIYLKREIKYHEQMVKNGYRLDKHDLEYYDYVSKDFLRLTSVYLLLRIYGGEF